MNKSDLKNFAIHARLELLRRVSDRAALYGISETAVKDQSIVPSAAFHKIDGTPLTASECARRNALIIRAYQIGYRPAMEEAAYTWFNRFVALKYLQENNLLPIPMRALPDAPGAQPQILREAQDVSLPNVDPGEILSMLDGNRTDDLYKYLLLKLCDALSETLPGMFREISGATELLFPDGLLRADSVLGALAKLSADCWSEIQVVGWLYQYYNTELKQETFDLLKKNVKIAKDRIGAATQLFTPEWIVNYMVENSLGRLWLEGHPDEGLRAGWRYFMDEAAQTPEVAAKLSALRTSCASLQPEAITVLDPCMGSGHILVYAFDVLMQIYRSVGYTDRDAVQSIVENNLYGLDIDDRAAQLAYFAVMMKACEYDRRFLRRGVQPHVCAIQEGAPVDATSLSALGAERSLAERLMQDFTDAKEYGSILRVRLSDGDLARLSARLDALEGAAHENLIAMADGAQVVQALRPLVNQAQILNRKYDIVITNPPYMGASGMNAKLSDYVKDNYPDSKSDLFAVFMERCGEYLKDSGYQAMITQHAWMFLSSFEKLRQKLQMRELVSMAHLGARAFEEIGGEVVQTTAFVLCKKHIQGYKGGYARLIDPTTQDGKEEMYLSEANRYAAQQDNFKKIPGSPIAYWVSERFISKFDKEQKLGVIARARSGAKTGNNELFIRNWWEISIPKMACCISSSDECIHSTAKWFPYNKGGEFRNWFGNRELVVNFENAGATIKEYCIANEKAYDISAQDVYFHEGITWTALTSSKNSFRFSPKGSVFDSNKGPMIFPKNHEITMYILALLISPIARTVFEVVNPSLSLQNGDVDKLPIIIDMGKMEEVCCVSERNVSIGVADYTTFETNWDFKKHPMI